MASIPQRELRNNVGAVLRRVEAGESFVVTVGGRPVASLGPLATSRTPASGEELAAILRAAPVDDGWSEDLERMREEERDAARDPWDA